MADVALRSVTKRFGETVAVDAMDLSVADGEFVVLLGPTGAGKTTTLRLVAGLERPDSGKRLDRRTRRDADRARGARRHLRVPAIFALSAPLGARESRLPAPLAGAPAWRGRDQGARGEGRRDPRHLEQA